MSGLLRVLPSGLMSGLLSELQWGLPSGQLLWIGKKAPIRRQASIFFRAWITTNQSQGHEFT